MAFFDLHENDTKTRKGFTSDALRERHARALRGFKASASFFEQQRRREVEDLKFVDHDEQWDPTAKTQRAGNQSVNGLPPTPPRPTIVVNQILGPLQQVANTRRAARIGLDFAPKGPGSSDDVAEVFEDIVRAAQQESRASIARNWAADRAEKAGLGWYEITTEYAADSNDPAAWNDQDICWSRILNQGSVYPDPYAQQPDFCDGRRWYKTEDLPLDVYKDRYPDSDLASYSNGELSATGDTLRSWVFTTADADGSETQMVRIAEVWEVSEAESVYVKLKDGRAVKEAELTDDMVVATGSAAQRRRKRERTIEHSIINGVEYLEPPEPYDGLYVPLIPTVGVETNVNGERRWRGMVRPARDAQMASNVLKSARLESIGLATKAPYIGFMETIEPYLEWWKQSNIRNYFILPLKAAYDRAGNLLPFPKRNVEEPAIQAITIAAQSADNDIHITTGVPPVALGELDPHDRSGVAISKLQGQSEVGASGYLGNLVDISMAYEGKVIRDLLPRIFDRPGRIVPAVGVDEKRRLVMLNYPYVEGPNGPVPLPHWNEGDPVPSQVPGPPSQPGQPPMMLPVKYYNLRDAELTVTPIAGKSYATRREEASAAIGVVMQTVPPEIAAAIAPAWLEEQDYPGAKKIAEIAKNALPPQLRAAYEDDTTGLPPQAAAQMQAMQQQIQQLTQAIQTKQVEQQGKLQVVQVQEAADSQRADAANRTAILKAEIAASATESAAQVKVDAENFRSAVDAMQSDIAKKLDLHMQQVSDALQRQHEHVQNALDRIHEVNMAKLGHRQTLEAGAQQAEIAAQQQANQPQEQP